MSCFINGALFNGDIDITIPPPEHVRYTDETTNGAGESLDLDQVVDHEYRTEQVNITLESVPALAGLITIAKRSVDGAKFNVVLREIDPVAEAATDIVCLVDWIFFPGDTIDILYANPDDLDCTSEILLVRVD